MINGAPIIQDEIAKFNQDLEDHITLLETVISETNDPREKEKGRAAIRRLRLGIEGDLKK